MASESGTVLLMQTRIQEIKISADISGFRIRNTVTILDIKGVKSSVFRSSCDEGLVKYPDLFLDFISDLYFQIQEVPRDFFVDIGKNLKLVCWLHLLIASDLF
jgi:hypothetical protein